MSRSSLLGVCDRRAPNISWDEFYNLQQTRFARNQHEQLIRGLLHIAQTTTVEDYVERFVELYDHLIACEIVPDPPHHVTRFLDGLKPAVKVQVAIQKPRDPDTGYELALLLEEI